MKEFSEMIKEAEDIDMETRARIIKGKSEEILPLLSSYSYDGMSGSEVFSIFLLGAMSADGKLSEEEYEMLSPLLREFLGDSIIFSDVRKAVAGVRRESRELKEITGKMLDLIGKFSPSLREDLIMVVMLISGADNKISLRERLWIRKLLF